MACLIEWSPQALEDIDLLAEYIARDSAFYARAVVRKLVEAAQSLSALPQRGRIVPEFGNPSIRELFVYSYRLIYRLDTPRIIIVAVIHGKRVLSPLPAFS